MSATAVIIAATGVAFLVFLYSWCRLVFGPLRDVKVKPPVTVGHLDNVVRFERDMSTMIKSWAVKPETQILDLATAPIEQLGAALDDCCSCTVLESTEYALKRREEIKVALRVRFPDNAEEVIAHAWRLGRGFL